MHYDPYTNHVAVFYALSNDDSGTVIPHAELSKDTRRLIGVHTTIVLNRR